MKEKDL